MAAGIAALAGDVERACIEVGAEDLDRRPQFVPRGLLQQQHGDRIGLLAGGAARTPRPGSLARPAVVLEQFRHRTLLRVSRNASRVAEKRRHRNQQVGQQRLRLFGVVAQHVVIVVQIVGCCVTCMRRAIRRSTVERLYLEKSWPVRTRRLREDAAQQLLVQLSDSSATELRLLESDQFGQPLRRARAPAARSRRCRSRSRCAASRDIRPRRDPAPG